MRFPLGRSLALALLVGISACGDSTPQVAAGRDGLGALGPELDELLKQAIETVEGQRDSAAAWLELAEIYDANSLAQDAVRCYGQVLVLHPDARSNYLLGRLLWDLGELESAGEYLEDARRLDPSYAPIHWRLGRFHREAGRMHEALAAFEKALELAPGDHAASMGMARCLLSMGQPERAADVLEPLLQLNKRSKRALNLMARVLERLGRSAEAQRMAQREAKAPVAPERDDWLARVQNWRVGTQVVLEQALALMASSQSAEAIELLELQRPQSPGNLGLWNLLLRGMILEQRHDDALALYAESLQFIEEHHLLLISQGRAFLGKKQFGRASRSFQKAVDLAPGFGEAHACLGEAFLNMARFAEAADELLSATRLEQTSVRDWLALGQAELQAKRFELASKHAQEALKLHARVPDLWALATDAAIQNGQQKLARKSLDMLAKRSAQHPRLDKLRSALETMGKANDQ
jgi:tetratricopeptide (TPR) repeat protein